MDARLHKENILNVEQKLELSRSSRLLQISVVCIVALLLAAIVAQGVTRPILAISAFVMLGAIWFAWKKRPILSATILFTNLLIMLSVLAWQSGGIRDIAVIGFPVVLVMAAILSNARLFFFVLFYILGFCSFVAIQTVLGHFSPHFPHITYAHLVYINLIFMVTGFGVYILVRDLHKLMASLRAESTRAIERESFITQLANRDQLTNLHNRRYAEGYFDELLKNTKQLGYSIVIYFLDLDNFKPVNDALGHAAGDALLKDLANRLTALARPGDMLCRFGGDEFLWAKIYPKMNEESMKQHIYHDAQLILKASSTPFFVFEHKIEVSSSLGVTIAPHDGESFTELVRCADLAMFEAKEKGRNTFSLYHEGLHKVDIDKYNMLKNIRKSLSEQQFEVWYQPKVDITTQKITSCEALVRWPQPDGSFIRPDQFIPLAESSGLINELGLYVLEQACKDCAHWYQLGFSHIGLSVNASAVQFRGSQFPQQVAEVLARTKIPAHLLEIELTESLLVENDRDIVMQIEALHQLGVSLAIDDFGTGYSNLSYLRKFKARHLKIDRSFIFALGVSDREKPVVQAIIQMAHSLGLATVAEGIEDEDSLRELQRLGCDQGQGFLWSPAVPLDQWLELLQQDAKSEAKAAL